MARRVASRVSSGEEGGRAYPPGWETSAKGRGFPFVTARAAPFVSVTRKSGLPPLRARAAVSMGRNGEGKRVSGIRLREG